ncbi:hypothetical protein A9Q89_05115 [Gammaproteobacteria bacterium 53_120_T64]|nr:hypothetical protein A9Q89_05115 [Gammaproteobacteria bacterium 53_120_T64]
MIEPQQKNLTEHLGLANWLSRPNIPTAINRYQLSLLALLKSHRRSKVCTESNYTEESEMAKVWFCVPDLRQ